MDIGHIVADFNWLAIIVATVAAFVLGGAWYAISRIRIECFAAQHFCKCWVGDNKICDIIARLDLIYLGQMFLQLGKHGCASA